MKRLLLLAGLAIILSTLAGCQNSDSDEIKKPVVAEQNSYFPEFLVGTWKAESSPWRITLGPDGTVSSALIPMGQVEVRPNQTTKVEMRDGQYSTYKAGDFDVVYNPADKELFVSIEMLEYHIVYLDNVIDGNSIDRFAGEVTEDGKYWMADWIKIFDYGPRFPQDPNDIYTVPIVFKKIEE